MTAQLRHTRTVRKHCPQCDKLSDRLMGNGRAGLCGKCLVHLTDVRDIWRADRRVRGLCLDCGGPKEPTRSDRSTCQGCADCKAEKQRQRNHLQRQALVWSIST